jgi:hypothetical protein
MCLMQAIVYECGGGAEHTTKCSKPQCTKETVVLGNTNPGWCPECILLIPPGKSKEWEQGMTHPYKPPPKKEAEQKGKEDKELIDEFVVL